MTKPRPTDAEFDELKRKRDEAIHKVYLEVCKEYGWDPATTQMHVSHSDSCYCACPDGPCQHLWNGAEYTSDDGCTVSITCSRCGLPAIDHDMRVGP